MRLSPNFHRFRYLTPILFFTSCSRPLLNPLVGGTNFTINQTDNKGRYGTVVPKKGSLIFLTPSQNLNVRAIENCKISFVYQAQDSSIFIVAEGLMVAGYGNLSKSFVTFGETVSKGQIIGRLYPPDSTGNNTLEISLRKGSTPIIPKW